MGYDKYLFQPPVIADTANTEEIYRGDENRIFESTGSAGRQFYSYGIDTVNHILHLANKNRKYSGEQLTLHYKRPDSNRIILSGLNEKSDSIHVVLDRIKKIYLLDESYNIPKKRSVFE